MPLRLKPAVHTTGLAALLAATLLTSCHSTAPSIERDGPNSLGLASASLPDHTFRSALTCDGPGTSPAPAWNTPPAGTRSLALIVDDRDASGGSFVHWILYNVPAESRSLRATFPTQAEVPDGTRQGMNDFSNAGYGEPCRQGTHRYSFILFALDAKLNLHPGSTRAQLDAAMKGHVLARGTLTARYNR